MHSLKSPRVHAKNYIWQNLVSAGGSLFGGVLSLFVADSAHFTRRGGILRLFAANPALSPQRGGILSLFAACRFILNGKRQ